ncbi:MAG TPA: hypothetical protein VEL03_20285 [Streptosporangiaceae bacterium]|nr:hypothetical protein [Streptosporangiaceae bacterium]
MSRPGLAAAAAAALTARLSYAALCARPPAGEKAWTRTNHRGEAVTLLEGPAVAIGGMAGALLAPGASRGEKVAMMVAGAGAAAFGGYDDLAGDGASKGFRGHLGALRRGELTTGAVKIAGIGATSLAAALALGADESSPLLGAADAVVNAGLIAGGANLMNLFDLRPGRAIKVALGAGALMAALPGRARAANTGSANTGAANTGAAKTSATLLAAAPLAAAAALLSDDLGERSMLGDAGANAIGAMLGVAATALPRKARIAALTGVAGLTAASEVVSFTRVIERTGPLRWLDMLGRRPARADEDR